MKRVRQIGDWLRLLIVGSPLVMVAFVAMLPALVREKVPVRLWLAAVLYALLHGDMG